MRLTLRTLLSYLDDMLDPAETKAIGQKVAESDAAQELIARIKQVTRRRRLTTPPATGPGSFDPNTVAEYLDNALPPEQVAEVEKACLESDVHLAEIAATHQILTLASGQRALVPPTATRRMYALVRGREAIPTRRPKAAAVPSGIPEDDDGLSEEDETLLLGLPMYRRHAAWVRWLLPVAAVLLVVILGFAIWRAIPSPSEPPVAKGPENGSTAPATTEPSREEPKKEEPSKEEPKKEEPKKEEPKKEEPKKEEPKTEEPSPVRPQPPRREREETGRYVTQVGAPPNVLLARAAGQERWERLSSGGKVFTSDMLVSLPGYRSEVRLDSDVYVTLWGNLLEFAPLPVFESAAILHPPTSGFDADLTLDRGVLLIANHKEKEGQAARVRVRFHGEVWDVTLSEPGTEIGLTLAGRYMQPYGTGEGPQSDFYFFVLKGRATVRVRFVSYPDLGAQPVPTVMYWDNKGKGIQGPTPARDEDSQAILTVWNKPPATEATREARLALDELSKRLSSNQPVEVVLAEILQPGEPAVRTFHRILAVLSLGALDAVPQLIDALGDDQRTPDVRGVAIFTLRHWLGRNDDQERKLFDPRTKAGVLIDKKYRLTEAQMLLELLHPFGVQQINSPETYSWLIDKLRHEKMAIRELAYWHLVRLAPAGRTIPYNPAEGIEQRERAYELWKKLIPDGKLPPPPSR
jgi:hypothetical protein